MARFTDAEVREALGLDDRDAARRTSDDGTAQAYAAVSTDTRSLEPDALFVALVGERFDAHEFLAEAAERGARGAVVSRVPDDAPDGLRYYRVEDTLVALGRLARYHRRRLDARVCAITGTNGKTTTKEMTAAALGTRFRVHATTGNLNNLVGAPLTLLSAPADTEALVVEVGTNAPGEIARLGAIVEPDVAVLTGVAEGHLDGLRDLDGVLHEKTSLLEALPPDGVAIVADEPAVLPARARSMASDVRVAGWTDRADAALRATDVRLDAEGRVGFDWRGQTVRLALRGRPNARNALLALGVAEAWGVDADEAVAGLERLEPAKMRMEFHRYGPVTVIADCYNANPKSVEAALDLLVSLPREGRRVAVVGTMKELGEASAELHRELAEAMAGGDAIDLIVATGDFVPAFDALVDRLGDRLIRAEDPVDAYPALAERMQGGEVVLLKGSRGVALERLLPLLERDWAEDDGRTGGDERSGGGGAGRAGGDARGGGDGAADPVGG